jgi:multidrug resistance efflux pump
MHSVLAAIGEILAGAVLASRDRGYAEAERRYQRRLERADEQIETHEAAIANLRARLAEVCGEA